MSTGRLSFTFLFRRPLSLRTSLFPGLLVVCHSRPSILLRIITHGPDLSDCVAQKEKHTVCFTSIIAAIVVVVGCAFLLFYSLRPRQYVRPETRRHCGVRSGGGGGEPATARAIEQQPRGNLLLNILHCIIIILIVTA